MTVTPVLVTRRKRHRIPVPRPRLDFMGARKRCFGWLVLCLYPEHKAGMKTHRCQEWQGPSGRRKERKAVASRPAKARPPRLPPHRMLERTRRIRSGPSGQAWTPVGPSGECHVLLEPTFFRAPQRRSAKPPVSSPLLLPGSGLQRRLQVEKLDRLHLRALRSRYEITCTSISISLRLLMPFRNVSAQLILLRRLTFS